MKENLKEIPGPDISRAAWHRFVPPTPKDGKDKIEHTVEIVSAAAERVPKKEATGDEVKGP